MSPRTVIASLLLALLFCRATFAQFIQEQPTDAGADLQTRLTAYTHPAGVTITLIATVHVGDASYYDAIARELQRADAVIHEGARLRADSRRVSLDFASALRLSTQTRSLKLVGDRFIRADMDGLVVSSQPEPPSTRRALADGLLALERDPQVARATSDAYAIPDRNAIAVQALRHRLARGDTHIVLLYGAAHAPDLDRRLRSQLGFAPARTHWLTVFAIDG